MEDQVLAMLRGQLVNIILGAVFLFIGLAACSVAAIRRRGGVRIFVWLGIWSALYGAMQLGESPTVLAASLDRLAVAIELLELLIWMLPFLVAEETPFQVSDWCPTPLVST